MTEKIPQNNISNFEEEKLRAEQEKKRVEKNRVQQETQQEENVARSYLQDNPEMLLSFLRSHESILTEESLSPETRIRIKKYLSDIVSVIMSARNHDDSVFKLQQEGIANPGEDEQGNFQITLENFVDPIIIMCLDEMKSRERVADVISLHGAENTLTQEEIFEQKILMTFNAIDDFYADAEKASVTSQEINKRATFDELRRIATVHLDKLDRLRDTLENGYGHIMDEHRERWMIVEGQLGRVINFSKKNS